MNKLFAKIASLTLGLALVAGAGVALASNAKEAKGVKAVESLAATFTCGADGDASHADGSSATSYSETQGDYTLSISNVAKFYTGARDAKGNGCLKFGTSSVVGSMSIAVPSDIVLVKLYVGGYKANSAKISVNGGSTQTITDLSNNGAYTAVDVNTTTNKTLTFTTVSGGVRAMINTIEFYINAETGKDDSSVSITNAKPLELDINDSPVQLAVTTSPNNIDLTYTSSNENVVTVSDSGLVTIVGLGTSTVTAAFAGDDDYNPSSDTISVHVAMAEPAHITGKTISQVVSEITEAGTSTPVAIYEVEGYVTAWDGTNTDGTQYGNFYIADTAGDTTNAGYVYGANYGNSPTWNGEKYTFSNNKSFLTNEITSQIVIGSKITANFMAWMYNGSKFEFQGEIKTVENDTPVVTHTVSFLANGGEGTMDSVQVNDGASYTLPTCTFTAPEGKVFDHWEVGGVEKTSLESVTADVEVTATWKDAPSEVDATMAPGTNGSAAKVVVSEVEKDAIKVGTSSKGGDMTITVGTGATYVKFYAAAWKGVEGLSLNISGATANPASIDLTADEGIANSSPFTLSGSESSYLFTVVLSNITSETTLTLATSIAKRFVLWGAVYGSGSTPTPPPAETYTVSFDGNGATGSMSAETDVSGSYTLPNNGFDVPEGKQFAGWKVNGEGETKAAGASITVSADVILVAQWEDAPQPGELATYKKVETNLADFSGTYLIVYEGDSTHAAVAFNGSLDSLDVAQNGVAVEINNGFIELSSEYEFIFAKKEGGYSVKSASGLYVGKTASGSGMNTNSSDVYTNSISYSAGEPEIKGEGGPVLRYNYASGGTGERFRFYNSGQQAFALYQKVADKADKLALDLLNGTYATCAAGYDHSKGDFTDLWSDLVTAYNGLDDGEKAKLADVKAKENGVMLEEAMARYDLLVAKYELTSFIDGRPAVGRYSPISSNEVDSNAAITIITIIAVTSISAIAVLLVVKKRKTY